MDIDGQLIELTKKLLLGESLEKFSVIINLSFTQNHHFRMIHFTSLKLLTIAKRNVNNKIPTKLQTSQQKSLYLQKFENT